MQTTEFLCKRDSLREAGLGLLPAPHGLQDHAAHPEFRPRTQVVDEDERHKRDGVEDCSRNRKTALGTAME